MPQTLFDAEGKEVEVPSSEENDAMEEERKDLKTQLDAIEEGSSEGVKSLREAIKRRDTKISSLEEKIGTPPEEEKKPILKEGEPVIPPKGKDGEDTPDPMEAARQESRNTVIDIEVRRDLSELTSDEKDAVQKVYKKLTAGEEVTVDNYSSFLNDAKKMVVPDFQTTRSTGITHGGRPARSEGEKKDFSDTEGGKAFGSKLGLKLEEEKK